MPEPSDEMTSGADGRGRLRASDADRDQAVEVLKAAFVQGRLDRDEFAARVGLVLAARTYADLDSPAASVPARLPPAEPSVSSPERRPAPSPIARLFWPRRRAICLVAGLLLMAGGMALPSVVAFVAGVVVVGMSAPSALPGSPEGARVRAWQRLDRRQTDIR